MNRVRWKEKNMEGIQKVNKNKGKEKLQENIRASKGVKTEREKLQTETGIDRH